MKEIDEVVSGFRQDNRLEYRFTIKDSSGTLIDDANLTAVEIKPGDGRRVIAISAELVNISTGTYDLLVILDTAGEWFYEFVPTDGQSYLIYVPVTEKL